MFENWLANSPWTGTVIWILLFMTDYYLTIQSAKGFKEIGHFQFEGSFELTPFFQDDINALRPISKRHILMIVLVGILLPVLWYLPLPFSLGREVYLMILGMFILSQVVVQNRHFRNLILIGNIKQYGGAEGQITYSQHLSYRTSAFDIFLTGTLFLWALLFSYSSFLLGGLIICFALATQHTWLAAKAYRAKL